MEKDLDITNSESVAEFLEKPTLRIAEAITGALGDVGNLKFAAGRIVQGAIKGKFLTQLGIELRDLIEKGRIKEDYFETHKNRASLLELLKFIDEGVPDEEVFIAMKNIFIRGIAKDATESESILANEFLQVAKQLKSGDILVLKACYELYKKYETESLEVHSNSAEWWLSEVSKITGFPPSLIELHEDKLRLLKLIGKRTYNDGSGISSPKTFQLSKFGLLFYEFILEN